VAQIKCVFGKRERETAGGFVVDEMPDPVNSILLSGSYATTYEAKDGQLIFNA